MVHGRFWGLRAAVKTWSSRAVRFSMREAAVGRDGNSEDEKNVRSYAGTSTTNLAPEPGEDSTLMRPPWWAVTM